MLFSDSHCHLQTLTTKALDQQIEMVKERNIELLLNASFDITSSEHAMKIAQKYSVVKACIGHHPYAADTYPDTGYAQLKRLVANPEVVAISEVGLDYIGRRNSAGEYVYEYVDKRIQWHVFQDQLQLAKEAEVPVFIHDRIPRQEMLDILEKMENVETGVAIHGFTKDLAYAQRCVDLGIYLSIGLRGVLAQENNALREAIQYVPLEWLVTETDSNRPDQVVQVVQKIAEWRDLSVKEVGKITTLNLHRLISRTS
jgi:TatD DNase family protein